MLKLPKGLKKKKKGKKSKKDQELFTEEELQQYKREHQVHSEHQTDEQQHPEKSENDDEWSKFAALTTGVDSILKKTQGDLDRIKSTSFFKRVPPPSEKVEEKTEEATAKEPLKEPEERDEAKELLNAVVELSESEEESEYDDSAFDTTFTDKVEAGELPLAYVPESPEEETDLGPDPFDTGYAEKVIKGPEVSSRGKRLVNIGAAVEVLTGKVETAAASAKTRRQRRGIQNLLLESFEANLDEGEVSAGSGPIVATTLLDEPTELEGDVPIDLSVSLHLNLLQQQQKNKQENVENQEDNNVLEEFDVLKKDDAIDGNAQLASQLSYTGDFFFDRKLYLNSTLFLFNFQIRQNVLHLRQGHHSLRIYKFYWEKKNQRKKKESTPLIPLTLRESSLSPLTTTTILTHVLEQEKTTAKALILELKTKIIA